MWLCTRIIRALEMVESCSKSQKMWQVFYSILEKKILVGGCGFFMSDVISGGLLGHFGPFHLALGTNR